MRRSCGMMKEWRHALRGPTNTSSSTVHNSKLNIENGTCCHSWEPGTHPGWQRTYTLHFLVLATVIEWDQVRLVPIEPSTSCHLRVMFVMKALWCVLASCHVWIWPTHVCSGCVTHPLENYTRNYLCHCVWNITMVIYARQILINPFLCLNIELIMLDFSLFLFWWW